MQGIFGVLRTTMPFLGPLSGRSGDSGASRRRLMQQKTTPMSLCRDGAAAPWGGPAESVVALRRL